MAWVGLRVVVVVSLLFLNSDSAFGAYESHQGRKCLPNAVQVDTNKPLVQLTYLNWASNELSNVIGGILVQDILGYPVSVRPDISFGVNGVSGYEIWDMIANYTFAACLEVWPSYYPIEMPYYVRQTKQVDVFPLGSVGRAGWYYFTPDSLVSKQPIYGRLEYTDLKNPTVASVFNEGSNMSRAIFHTVDAGWSLYDIMLIANYELLVDVIFHQTEEALIGNLSLLYDAGVPHLTYLYRPHYYFSKNPMKRLSFPEFSDECYAKTAVAGVNCDYPSDALQKAISPSLRKRAPGAYSIFQQMLITTNEVETMLGLVKYFNKPMYDVACEYLMSVNETVETWAKVALAVEQSSIVADQPAGQNMLVAGALAGIIVAGVVVVTVLVIGTVVVKRQLSKTRRAVKELHEEKQASFNIGLNDLVYGKLIGKGNFGEVFVGEYRGTEVAIKRLMNQKKMSSRELNTFQQEVATMVRLRHPNIVLFMGACAQPPNVSIVTEYMKCGNLYELLRANQNPDFFSLRMILNLAISISKGMQYIHASGMLHRDLKTPNLLLDRKLNVKISDFGLSCMKQDVDSLDQVSLLWTAPEILQGNKYTDKADVYSFGIILWELFGRTEPYPKINTNAIASAVIKGMRPAVSPDWNKELVSVMQECWQKDASKRPTFAQISKSLDAIQVDEEDNAMSDAKSYYFNSSNNTTSDKVTAYMLGGGASAAPSANNSTTFVMTKVQDAALLWEWNAMVMAESLALLNKEMQTIAGQYRGYLAVSNGECSLFAFPNPLSALSCCMHVQKAIITIKWPSDLLANFHTSEEWSTGTSSQTMFRGLKVGMGVNSGLPQVTNDLFQVIFSGPPVDRAVSIGVISRGGQILLSKSVMELMSNNGNLFVKMEPHFVEIVTFECTFGPLYELTPTCFKNRILSGPTNTELLTQIENNNNNNNNTITTTATTPKSTPKLTTNLTPTLPTPQEKWMVGELSVETQNLIGHTTLGHLYKAKYCAPSKGTPFPVSVVVHSISQKVSESAMLDMRVEAARLVQLKHNNVSTFYGLVHTPTKLLWEHCSRGFVSQMIEDGIQSVTFSTRVKFLVDIAQGMVYLLASFGGIPVDLRPNNLVVTEEWCVKITDYGFAPFKNANQTITQNRNVSWTAPEVFSGAEESELTNVYSFGVIMWQFLTSKWPWEGKHAMKVIYGVESGERPPIPDHSSIPEITDIRYNRYIALMQSCWAQSPQDRPTFSTIIHELIF